MRSASFDTTQGFGLRAISGEAAGYAHSSELSEDAIRRAGDTVKSVRAGHGGTLAAAPSGTNVGLYTETNPLGEVPFEEKVALLSEIDAYLRAKDPRVNQVMASEFPGLNVLPVLEGRDEDARSEQLLARLLGRHADIVGLYNVGAGTQGVAKALGDAGRNEVVFVAHDVTTLTRRLLLQGVMAAAISQNPGHEARAAVRVLLALARGEPILREQEKIRIDIVMRDNLP